MAEFGDFLVNACLRALISSARILPYESRVIAGGKAMTHLIAPFTSIRERVNDNLDLVFPDMPAQRREQILASCLDNFGRLLLENYSAGQFCQRAGNADIAGPGYAALKAAHASGQPAILVSGHFGNFQAVRANLISRGFRVGCLYRPMNNRFFNRHYVESIERIGSPAFPLGRSGLAEAIRLLRAGDFVALLNDQHTGAGAVLDFMGRPARTNTQVARMASAYGALLVPCYGIRKSNGLDFTVLFEPPIELSDPITTTQALNDSLEAQIRARPEQWYWVHRRWKTAR